MTSITDPTIQAAAAVRMALYAILLSDQAPRQLTGRQRSENEQDARTARKDAGTLSEAPMSGSRETHRKA